MIRCWIAAAVFAVVLAMPNRAEAEATANDEVLREVTALAEWRAVVPREHEVAEAV